MTGHPTPWDWWADARPAAEHIHLDSGAAGRSSRAVLEATAAHARREATVGAYVAAAEAANTLDSLRTDVASLTGVDRDGVAFVESAESALDAILRAWPAAAGDVVAVTRSEWGPNLHALGVAGLKFDWLDVDDAGLIDLDVLGRRLEIDPPALVHVTHQASHRALRQPVAEIATICLTAGVPFWVDAAQALGHCAVDVGADVLYATSRKWLTGPRGVGMLAVNERFRGELQIDTNPMMSPEDPVLASIESHEAHVAGRIGLATAVREFIDQGAEAIGQRLNEVGVMTRSCLAELANWSVVDPVDSPGAITAIAPTAGQDVFDVRGRLLRDHSIVTTACGTARAPFDMTEPWLRVSPHVDASHEQIETLRDALATM